jgi:dynein heavy chain
LVKRLDGGLTKLVQAASDVAEMKMELAKQTIVVEQKTRDCAALLEEITTSTEVATAKQEAAAQQEESLAVQSVEIAAQKEVAEEKLAAALPALEQAAEALNDLSKSDIDEMKSFAKPHPMVQVNNFQIKTLRETAHTNSKKILISHRVLVNASEFSKKCLILHGRE